MAENQALARLYRDLLAELAKQTPRSRAAAARHRKCVAELQSALALEKRKTASLRRWRALGSRVMPFRIGGR